MTVKEVVEKYARILMLPLYDQEDWRVIKDYPNYIVTSLGRIFNIKTGKVLKVGKNYSSRYQNRTYTTCYVILSNNGKTKKFYVHRLVANAFLDKPDGIDLVVNHKNHNTSDNRVENLEWIPRADNCSDQLNHNSWINYSLEELIEIREKFPYKSKEYSRVHGIITYRRRKLKNNV